MSPSRPVPQLTDAPSTTKTQCTLPFIHTSTQQKHTQHTFPPQPDVLAAMGRIAQKEKARDPSAVFYVGCYSIGKERCVCACVQGLWGVVGFGGGGVYDGHPT